MLTFSNNVCLKDATFDQEAEKEILDHLIGTDLFNDTFIQRKLACYAKASFPEKDFLILEFMEHFWQKESAIEIFYVFRDFDVLFSTLEMKGHFIHQFEVFIFGWCLFSIITSKKTISQNTYKKYFELWRMTSTLHDLGYPLELSDKLSAKFSKLYRLIGFKKLSKAYLTTRDQDLIKNETNIFGKIDLVNNDLSTSIDLRELLISGFKLSLGINSTEAKQLQQTLEKKMSHGFISAMILCRIYLKHIIKSYKRPHDLLASKNINDLKKIAVAVAIHDLPTKYKRYIQKIDFHKNPFAYILYLVDNLQEWSRELRQNNNYPSYKLIDCAINNSGIDLSYSLFHDTWENRVKNNLKNTLKEKREKIKLLSRPKPNLGLKINVTFNSNSELNLKPIKLEI